MYNPGLNLSQRCITRVYLSHLRVNRVYLFHLRVNPGLNLSQRWDTRVKPLPTVGYPGLISQDPKVIPGVNLSRPEGYSRVDTLLTVVNVRVGIVLTVGLFPGGIVLTIGLFPGVDLFPVWFFPVVISLRCCSSRSDTFLVMPTIPPQRVLLHKDLSFLHTPVSLLEESIPLTPVSLLGHTPGCGPMIPHFLNILDIPARTNVPRLISQECEKQ